MLFLRSGSISHSLNDEPDIRNTGGLFKALPFTTTALIIRNLPDPANPNRLIPRIHYTPDTATAFSSVAHIYRDVNYG
ncbi:hypothetical protein J1605_001210 [Eschrichtius robustus]|uniref:Uncharacterized protein n=1 Tax=Eschrichtius robustus TaxID=9764 RepID=A0AB34GDJ7_ESCRO|nr:hypothetical protein J1605_001210 [Eschrichtius robustus]